jgi:hypothetical protein
MHVLYERMEANLLAAFERYASFRDLGCFIEYVP